jgi:thymidylate synthase
MYAFEGRTASEVWWRAGKVLFQEGAVTESRNFRDPNKKTRTKELMHAALTIGDPSQRLVFGRVINPAFALVEVFWILAGANDAHFLHFWNPRMKTWCDDWDSDKKDWAIETPKFHGAYGARLGCRAIYDSELQVPYDAAGDFDQLASAYHALKVDPSSRQVVLNVYNSMHDMPDVHGPVSKDVPCNLIADLKVRNGKLHWLQTMRSNDFIWGTPYNFIQWTMIHEIMAGWLGLELGQFTLSTSSLHVYENHFDDLKEVSMHVDMMEELENGFDVLPCECEFGVSFERWPVLLKRMIAAINILAGVSDDAMKEFVPTLADYICIQDLPDGYKMIVRLLYCESKRRRGLYGSIEEAEDEAVQIINDTAWASSWVRWAMQQGVTA